MDGFVYLLGCMFEVRDKKIYSYGSEYGGPGRLVVALRQD